MKSLVSAHVRIAVVGAGIYGSTIAYKLAASNYKVDLYERKFDICSETTSSNQFRLHMGYQEIM